MQEILQTALQAMPREFTSNQFSKKAQQLGLSGDKINEGAVRNYLSVHANRGTTQRTWQKAGPEPEPKQQELFQLTDEMCIKHLKANGYKIMKMMEI